MISEIQAWELTDTNRDWLIHRPVEIAIYVALAVVLRFALHRGIDRMSKPRKSPNAKVNERRSQRARTIGSVLKSTVSIVILVWCVLQILGILGSTSRRSSHPPASSALPSVSVHKTWCVTSSPASSCCSRISTVSATSSISATRSARRNSGPARHHDSRCQRHLVVLPQRRNPASGQHESGLRHCSSRSPDRPQCERAQSV